MFKIGNIEINNPVVMAPMAGITNLAFRKIVKEFGAGLVYSEMVSDKAICYGNKKTLDMLKVDDEEHPVSIQLFGGEVESMVKAAKYIDKNSNCDIIDINCGCPVQKVLKANAGSQLLKDPQLIYEIVSNIVKNVKKPVTVKIRIGFDKEHINAVEVARLVERAGASAIAVHGRTRSQIYEGKADWSMIKKVKEAVTIPVIGNGDIRSVEDAWAMIEQTGCDAVMIGRAALGNPWLIKQVCDSFNGIKDVKEPTYHEKIEWCLMHAKRLMKIEPERIAISQMRGHAPWYIKGLKNSSKVKNELAKVNSFAELEKILKDYENELNQLI